MVVVTSVATVRFSPVQSHFLATGTGTVRFDSVHGESTPDPVRPTQFTVFNKHNKHNKHNIFGQLRYSSNQTPR